MYLSSPNLCSLIEAAQALLETVSEAQSATVFFWLGESCSVDIIELIEQLNQRQIQFAGGVFPSVFSGSHRSASGAVVFALPTLFAPTVVQGLESAEVELPDFGKNLNMETDGQPTVIVLVDGLAANIGSCLMELYDTLGDAVHYFGGGAGSLSLQQRPCVFGQSGFFQNAAIITFVDLESSLGVSHGWERLSGPVIASKTDQNTLSQLNWKNAFEVYKSVVEVNCNQTITQDNFFEISKGYPFGLIKENQEDIVRDPIVVNDLGELICVGEVPENASLYILKGNNQSLIEAAYQAAKTSADIGTGQADTLLVVDCISRVLFLEEEFDQELVAIQKGCDRIPTKNLIPEGILTLGEISSYGEGFLEWFNKTIVVATFYPLRLP